MYNVVEKMRRKTEWDHERFSKIMAEQNMISSEDWDQTMKFDIWRSN